jgi:phage replication O-like protein O
VADVQLEKGFVRIANRLFEAVLVSSLSDRQVRLVLALIRMTYGWRRLSVVTTTAEWTLAAGLSRGHARAPGNVRADVNELIAEGVILSDRTQGSRKATYGLQKDFSRWGRFSIGEERLRSLWSERPDSNDSELRELASNMASTRAMSSIEGDDDDEPEHGLSQGHVAAVTHGLEQGHVSRGTWPTTGPSRENTTWPSTGPSHGPVQGHVGSSKPFNGETYKVGKTGKTVVSSRSTVPSSGAGIARARENPPPTVAPLDQQKPTADRRDSRDRFIASQRRESRADWRTELAAAEQRYGAELVAAVCRDCLMADRPVTSPRVFRIFCANAAKDVQQPSPSPSPPVSGTARAEQRQFDAAAVARGRDELRAYALARREAGERWAEDPVNAGAWAVILTEARVWLGPGVSLPGGEANVERRALEVAGERSGFPDFDAWHAAQSSEPS